MDGVETVKYKPPMFILKFYTYDMLIMILMSICDATNVFFALNFVFLSIPKKCHSEIDEFSEFFSRFLFSTNFKILFGNFLKMFDDFLNRQPMIWLANRYFGILLGSEAVSPEKFLPRNRRFVLDSVALWIKSRKISFNKQILTNALNYHTIIYLIQTIIFGFVQQILSI